MDQRSPGPFEQRRSLPPHLAAIFASASIPTAALATPLGVYIPNYYASHLGLSLAVVGGVVALVRLIDLGFDLLIGVAINATHTPLGRFRPWMVAGVPVLVAAVYAIFMAEQGVKAGYLAVWLLVLYGGWSMVSVGHASWAAALFPEYHARSRIYGLMQAVGVAGLVGILLLPSLWPRSSASGIHAMGYYAIFFTPVTVLLCASLVVEPKRSELSRPATLQEYWTTFVRASLGRVLAADLALALGPAITGALYLFFFQQALGYSRSQTGLLLVLYIFAGLFGAPFWAMVARRLGKHRTVMLGCVLYGFAQALVFVIPRATLSLMIPGMFFAGFVVSSFTFLIRAMIADISDEIRLETGKDRTAILYGLITSTSKVGSTISLPIAFSILALFGFNAREGVVNTGTAMDALVACYVVVPVLTMFVGAAMLRGYKLDARRHDEIRAQLSERDLAISGMEGVAESLGGTPSVRSAELNPGE
jgi:GPH family glycoside/pentoside/hexuronide:cation symporter